MSSLGKERESRIELIRSIALSQRAVARILNSIADVSEASPGMAKCMRDNLSSITALQLTMADMVSGVRIRRLRHGQPSSPWLHHKAFAPPGSAAASQRPNIAGGE